MLQEALERGVVVYLPEIHTGGKPVTKKKDPSVCKDPIKCSHYNAISWSDQGAFTGDMISVHLRLAKHGVRWFDGKNINSGYTEDVRTEKFGYLYSDDLLSEDEDDSDCDGHSE